MAAETDRHRMRHALQLAARNLGQTWPNPAVGAMVIQGENVVGVGWTAKGGRPHAETEALKQAGADAMGATLYVTLEPCCHHGKTPPCTDAIIAAGIRRAVIACPDPAPRVNGSGVAKLREAGIEVTENVLRDEAEALNAGFFSVLKNKRPYVTLKLATSLDGKNAYPNGESKWITGEHARAMGHRLRATHDAILTGIGTAATDDPLLTCRLPGMEHRSPVRVVLDSSLRLSPESQLVRTAKDVPLWVFTTESADQKKRNALEKAGVRLFTTPLRSPLAGEQTRTSLRRSSRGGISLDTVLQTLAEQGITCVLAEPGSRLSTALLQEDLVDKIHWFRAPMVLGEDARPALGPLALAQLDQAFRFESEAVRTLGPDRVEAYTRLK